MSNYSTTRTDNSGGSGKRGALSAKGGRSSGSLVAGTSKRCNGGTAYKTPGQKRPGGELMGKGKKGSSY